MQAIDDLLVVRNKGGLSDFVEETATSTEALMSGSNSNEGRIIMSLFSLSGARQGLASIIVGMIAIPVLAQDSGQVVRRRAATKTYR